MEENITLSCEDGSISVPRTFALTSGYLQAALEMDEKQTEFKLKLPRTKKLLLVLVKEKEVKALTILELAELLSACNYLRMKDAIDLLARELAERLRYINDEDLARELDIEVEGDPGAEEFEQIFPRNSPSR